MKGRRAMGRTTAAVLPALLALLAFASEGAALGVAALIRSSELAFNAVRWAGAAYLVWIGIQALRHRASFSLAGGGDAKALAAIYRQSVIGNALNPKVTLFFLSFLPQFVDARAGGVEWQMALLGIVFMAQTVVIFGAVALFLVASALLTIAPGPDIVYVFTRGVSQGRKAGLAAALGLATGCLFHTALAAIGVAALIRSSELAFNAVLEAVLPTIPLRISALDAVLIAGLFIITGSASALAPVVRLSAIDPLEAFRS